MDFAEQQACLLTRSDLEVQTATTVIALDRLKREIAGLYLEHGPALLRYARAVIALLHVVWACLHGALRQLPFPDLMAVYFRYLPLPSRHTASYCVISREWLPIAWLIWYPAEAAYAIGPAYLAEAVAVATRVDQRYPAACSSNSSA
jgi:hypothetical protein